MRKITNFMGRNQSREPLPFQDIAVRDHNLVIISNFILTELVIALEQIGVFAYLVQHNDINISRAAKTLGVKEEFLFAACEFLTEEEIFRKNNSGTFSLAFEQDQLQWFLGFFLVYGPVFGSLAELMSGTKLYGRDVKRNDFHFEKINILTRGGTPLLLGRLQKLKINSAVTMGWDGHQLLHAAERAIPGFIGVGIDISEKGSTEEKISPTLSFLHMSPEDIRYPEFFPKEVKKSTGAIIGTMVFHEFLKDKEIIAVLRNYKIQFPQARLFIVELDDVSWEDLRGEPRGEISRTLGSIYKITHTFIDPELSQQSRDVWKSIFSESGWSVAGIYVVPLRIVIYECY